MSAKKIIILFIFCTLFISTFAQEKTERLSKEQQTSLTKEISSSSKGMNSLKCDFVQTKTISILEEEIVSSGKMYYLKDNKLRWEYIEPYTYEFIMNEDKILLKSENSSNVIDIKNNKLFREISKIIINGVNGTDIGNTEIYDTEFYAQKDGFLVMLFPKQNELKEMFHSIRLNFNNKDFTVEKIDIQEKGGDITHIELKNKQINEAIDSKVFSIH